MDLDQIPDDSISIFVGRVVRVDPEKYGKRIVQIWTNYPENLSGRILRFPFYHSVKKGDKVVVAGQLSMEWIEPILVRNLSSGIEKTGGSVSHQTILQLRGIKDMVMISPLMLKAQKRIDGELNRYEEQIAKITGYPPEPLEMSPSEFETLVADLFERLGFQNVVTVGGVGDKGVDIIASKTGEGDVEPVKIIAQCKYRSTLNRVMPTQVRDFAHTIEREKKNGIQRGYFVTSSYFSPECFDKENCGEDMELVDRDRLEILLKKVGLPIPRFT